LNNDISYIQNSGFNYYSLDGKLTPNRNFGTYQVVKQKPFTVRYTINKNRVWSDGTPITAVDLLIDFIVCSSTYSIKAGLGDPADQSRSPIFTSTCYGRDFDKFIVGMPSISADKLSITFQFSKPFPDWEIYSPLPFPIHALMLLSEGRSSLQPMNMSLAAKERFEAAFLNSDNLILKSVGNFWSTAYNLKEISASTNPLLLVNNGPYLVKSATPGKGIVLEYNERYNSGTPVSGVRKLNLVLATDSNAALTAVSKGDIDIYQASPVADSRTSGLVTPNVKVITSNQGIFEHIDLKIGSQPGSTTPYAGPFAGNSLRAQELRTAFLLAVPRDEIIEKVIAPINPQSQRLDSLLLYPEEDAYRNVTKNSGIANYSRGTQKEREARALEIVRKYFPGASASNPGFKVNLLWGTPTNSRRAAVVPLVKSALARAGIEVIAPGVANWATQLPTNNWDAAMFAWVKSFSQPGNTNLYCTSCGNNYSSYSNATVDKTREKLQSEIMTESEQISTRVLVEKNLFNDAVTLPLFQHPSITWTSSQIQRVKPSALPANIFWNFWEWTYPGLKQIPLYESRTNQDSPKQTPTPAASPTKKTPSSSDQTLTIPDAPKNLRLRIVGSSALISVDISNRSTAKPNAVFLVSKALGISESKPLIGKISGTSASFEIPVRQSMLGNKYPVSIFLANEKGRSKPLNGTMNFPGASKPTTSPAPQPEPTVPQTITCTFANQVRTFSGGKCPPGWDEY